MVKKADCTKKKNTTVKKVAVEKKKAVVVKAEKDLDFLKRQYANEFLDSLLVTIEKGTEFLDTIGFSEDLCDVSEFAKKLEVLYDIFDETYLIRKYTLDRYITEKEENILGFAMDSITCIEQEVDDRLCQSIDDQMKERYELVSQIAR